MKDTQDKLQSLYSLVIFFREIADTTLLCNWYTPKNHGILSTFLIYKGLQFSYYMLEGLGGIIDNKLLIDKMTEFKYFWAWPNLIAQNHI